MKRETETTTRLEWIKHRDEVQADVNETLDGFTLEIEAANLYLAQLHRDDRLEEAAEFAVEMVNEFDSRWKYNGDYFMLSGTWYEPQIHANADGITVEHTIEPVMRTVRSNGFIVHLIENEEESIPQIGYSFAACPPISISSNTVALTAQPLAFAELDAVSLQYMRPGEDEAVVSAELDEIFDRVARAESLIKLYTKNPHSLFFEQSARKQQRFFTDIIQMVDDAMPAPDSMDALVATVSTRCVYFGDTTDTYKRIQPLSDEAELNIEGQILGFLSLNQLPSSKMRQFSEPSDLIDPSCSLLAIIDPSDQDFLDEDQYEPGTPLLVPLDDTISLSAKLA